jgi:LPS export ABC transporter protein LptC
VNRDGRLSLELTAARAETWNDAKETILSDARFVQFDDTGAQATEGEAKKVVFHTDTENADVTGGVRVRSETEKGTVTAENLSWDNDARTLRAPPDEVVSLRKDDGSSLSGTGFEGDFRRRELTFTGPVRGTYVRSDEEKQ